jgi:hypothetical protein
MIPHSEWVTKQSLWWGTWRRAFCRDGLTGKPWLPASIDLANSRLKPKTRVERGREWLNKGENGVLRWMCSGLTLSTMKSRILFLFATEYPQEVSVRLQATLPPLQWICTILSGLFSQQICQRVRVNLLPLPLSHKRKMKIKFLWGPPYHQKKKKKRIKFQRELNLT